jgi:hypothetical protein
VLLLLVLLLLVLLLLVLLLLVLLLLLLLLLLQRCQPWPASSRSKPGPSDPPLPG